MARICYNKSMSYVPTPRQRLFTDEFKVGDFVIVTRYKHGYFDGGILGQIESLTEYNAYVLIDDGAHRIEIEHPRDIMLG